jgi:hypothetical protein
LTMNIEMTMIMIFLTPFILACNNNYRYLFRHQGIQENQFMIQIFNLIDNIYHIHRIHSLTIHIDENLIRRIHALRICR